MIREVGNIGGVGRSYASADTGIQSFYNGIVDAAGGGDFATIQAGDDQLDSGAYMMLVKQGSYTENILVTTNNMKIVFEPNTTVTGTIGCSGTGNTLEFGSGCAVTGLISMSGANPSLLNKNGGDTGGVTFASSTTPYLDGGGLGTIHDGASANIAIHCTAADILVLNCAAQTDTSGSGGFNTITLAGLRACISGVKVNTSDNKGVGNLAGGDDLILLGSYVAIADADFISTGSSRLRIIANGGGSTGTLDAIDLNSNSDNSVIAGNVQANAVGLRLASPDNCVVNGNVLDTITIGGSGNTEEGNVNTTF